MDALPGEIGQAWSAAVTMPEVRLAVTVAAAYLVVVWIATAMWVFVDARQRSSSSSAPFLMAAAVLVASPVLFPLAVLVHVIVRPSSTAAERRLARLQEAALGIEADDIRCGSCLLATDPDWVVCPACRSPVRHRCGQCDRPVDLDWDACAWCGSILVAGERSVRTDPRSSRVRGGRERSVGPSSDARTAVAASPRTKRSAEPRDSSTPVHPSPPSRARARARATEVAVTSPAPASTAGERDSTTPPRADPRGRRRRNQGSP